MLTKIDPFHAHIPSSSVIPRVSSHCPLPTVIHSQPLSTSLTSSRPQHGCVYVCLCVRAPSSCALVCEVSDKEGEERLRVKDENDLLRGSDYKRCPVVTRDTSL